MVNPMCVGNMLEKVKLSFGVDYFVDGINNKNCVVDLGGIPENRLILDLEKFALAKKFGESRCDYVLFIELKSQKVFCVLIELKGGNFVVSHVRRQLQGGADLVKSYCHFQMGCCALLIHKSGIKKVDKMKMARDRIEFESSVVITRSVCGRKGNIFLPIRKVLAFDN